MISRWLGGSFSKTSKTIHYGIRHFSKIKNQDYEQYNQSQNCLVLHPVMIPNKGPELEL